MWRAGPSGGSNDGRSTHLRHHAHAGFHEYTDGTDTGLWPGLHSAFGAASVDAGSTAAPSAPVPLGDLQERILFAEALETIRCFDEGVLRSATDANVGSLPGIGFPARTGGVLRYVDSYACGLEVYGDRPSTGRNPRWRLTMGILYLCVAIVSEVAATTSLKLTTGEQSRWWAWIIVVVGYVLAFTMLQRCLSTGFPLGIAYAIWCGVGVVAVVLVSILMFREGLSAVQLIGIVLVIAGVACLELGHVPAGGTAAAHLTTDVGAAPVSNVISPAPPGENKS
ncbi:hypothetical protein BH09ACT6_BH09ACT6_00270 [soil metagenome]